VVEVEVAHGDDIDRPGIEARAAESRHDPQPLVAAHRTALVVDPFADPGLDQDSPGRRLDQQAVQRLEEPVLGVDLGSDPAIPEDPGHRPEQRPRVRSKGARLNESDGNTATEVAPPVDRVVRASHDDVSVTSSHRQRR